MNAPLPPLPRWEYRALMAVAIANTGLALLSPLALWLVVASLISGVSPGRFAALAYLLLGLTLVVGYWRAAARRVPVAWVSAPVFWAVSAAFNVVSLAFWVERAFWAQRVREDVSATVLVALAWIGFVIGLSLYEMRKHLLQPGPASSDDGPGVPQPGAA